MTLSGTSAVPWEGSKESQTSPASEVLAVIENLADTEDFWKPVEPPAEEVTDIIGVWEMNPPNRFLRDFNDAGSISAPCLHSVSHWGRSIG